MEQLIEFIVGDATTFEPRSIIGLLVFILILDSLSMLVSTFVGGVKK